MRRVVVTGLGLVTPLGGDVETTWANLLASKSGAGRITRFDASEHSVQIGAFCAIDLEQHFSVPDLRKLDNDCAGLKDAKKKSACIKEIDEYYASSVRRGKVRNGAVYMPPFEGILNQEATWAIKSYLETRREKPM